MASAWHVGNSASTVPEKGATSSPETGLMPIPSPMALLENTGSATSAISMAVPGTGHSAEMPVAAAGASSVEGCSATAFSLWEADFFRGLLAAKETGKETHGSHSFAASRHKNNPTKQTAGMAASSPRVW